MFLPKRKLYISTPKKPQESAQQLDAVSEIEEGT